MKNYGFDKRVGIGLRAQHISAVMQTRPSLGWLEIHSENWMIENGPIAQQLQDLRASYPLSLHGVGLSLGAADGIDQQHLQKLASLVERCNPVLVSEHLSWAKAGGVHSNDLLPLPFNEQAISVLVNNIDCVQQKLGFRILVENLSSYCTFDNSTMPEWEFVSRVVEAADCGLLLDINNVFVNAHNHYFEAREYINALPMDRVQEVHLAGFDTEGDALVDSHARPVQDAVWRLYEFAIPKLPEGARTLIEWDTDLPELSVLLMEAAKASMHLKEYEHAVA